MKPKTPTEPEAAVVTRYPTGVFGIQWRGNMFWWWGHNEVEVHQKLREINPSAVKWEERYYDGDFSDPKNYKTRRYFPKSQPSTIN